MEARRLRLRQVLPAFSASSRPSFLLLAQPRCRPSQGTHLPVRRRPVPGRRRPDRHTAPVRRDVDRTGPYQPACTNRVPQPPQTDPPPPQAQFRGLAGGLAFPAPHSFPPLPTAPRPRFRHSTTGFFGCGLPIPPTGWGTSPHHPQCPPMLSGSMPGPSRLPPPPHGLATCPRRQCSHGQNRNCPRLCTLCVPAGDPRRRCVYT